MRWMLLAAACAIAPASAQTTIITMGRLFTTPVERNQLDQQRSSADPAALLGGNSSMQAAVAAPAPPPPPPPMAQAAPPPPPPEPLQLNGVLRRSNGKTIVWVNNEPQEAAPSARGQSVPLDLSGRKVIMKPGQSYDPATGAIGEAQR
ncbi:hypothetical protein [Massilia endophytica]|uniref:hypothetical protein n=1 Tax=Massilia endophytica TaxID=2899220 RepID=UPI001E3E0EA8|nr:hypothetical protein [Massilia endophytica]UGQ48360.1 hypothetical protein LSQ66_07800 [Massilia endophytica]